MPAARSWIGGLAMAAAALAAPGLRAEPPHAAAPAVIPLGLRGPLRGFNRLVVGIEVCAPGTRQCARIDATMVDTGSTGLRIEPGALPPDLRLPPLAGPDGRVAAECVRFVHDQAWGALARADLVIAGLRATDVPVQLVSADPEPHPAQCPASGVVPTSAATLGIGEMTDCPDPCDNDGPHPLYFSCEPGGCRPAPGPVAAADRLPNPLARLAGHDDGVVFDLPAVPPAGAEAVAGTLTLGLAGERDRLAGGRLLRLDGAGRFTTRLAGQDYRRSTIDSGTPTLVVPGEAARPCEGRPSRPCEAPARPFEAELIGSDGLSLPVSFRIGDAPLTMDGRTGASDTAAIAAPAGAQGFVWGAPFFLGRRIVFGFARSGRRPFYAITSAP